MKGAEQVRVFLDGRQVDAAGEESRIALSVTGRRFLRGESRYVTDRGGEHTYGAGHRCLRHHAAATRRCTLDTALCCRRGTHEQLSYAIRHVPHQDTDAASAYAYIS